MRQFRRNLIKYLRAANKGDMLAAASCRRSFDRPALVIWAKEDRVMPPEHGRRLAGLLLHGRLIEIADSYTPFPEDQPGALAHAIREFIRDTPYILHADEEIQERRVTVAIATSPSSGIHRKRAAPCQR